jgi:exopolysaccharide biosynthesis polyprenyl glycosylphosphotransferase
LCFFVAEVSFCGIINKMSFFRIAIRQNKRHRGGGMYRKKNQIMEIVICLIDMAVTFGSLWLAGLLRYGSGTVYGQQVDFDVLFSVIAVLHVAVFYVLRVCDGFYRRDRYQEAVLSVKYNLIVIVAAIFLGFNIKNEMFTSRLVMGYFFVMNICFIWVTHIFIRNWERVFHLHIRKETSILIVTTADKLESVLFRFHHSKEVRWKIEGVILLDETELPDGMEYEVPFVSSEEGEYLEFATQHVVDEVFIHVNEIQKRESYLKNMILELEKMGVVVSLSLDLFNLDSHGTKQIYNLEQYHVVAFSSRLFDYRMVIVKRLMDIVGALVGLAITLVVGIFLAPFLLLESKGPLIFCQNRVGVNGRIFKFYKFRSMYVDAEARKGELMAQNEVNGLMFKMENDPRITKVGAFIRRTSIDELPQFWNVLKGDMSLVGTRPPTVDEYEQYNYHQKRRISFRPGITGLWQISGRSDIKDFDEVVRMDLEYIDSWSLRMDLKIILKTIVLVIRGKGAR